MKKVKLALSWALSFMLIFSAFSTTILANDNATQKKTRATAHVNWDNVEITQAGSEDEIDGWRSITINVDWSIDNGTVSGNDKAYFTLPQELALVDDLSFPLKDGSGEVVANVSVDKDTNEGIITFTDYVESHSNVSGTMSFISRFNRENINNGSNTFTIFDKTITLEIQKDESMDYPILKYGYFTNDTKTEIKWVIQINVEKRSIPNAKLTDYIGNGHSLKPGSLRIERVKFIIDENGRIVDSEQKNETDSYTINYTSNGFTVDFGDIKPSDQFIIVYNTTPDAPVTEEDSFVNRAVLEGSDGFSEEESDRVGQSFGGGDAQGETRNLKIKKFDKNDTSINLENAVFELYMKNENGDIKKGELITNSDGEATYGNLIFGDYYLIETTPPDGYKLLEDKVYFTIDSQSDPEVLINIENEKKETEDPNEPTPQDTPDTPDVDEPDIIDEDDTVKANNSKTGDENNFIFLGIIVLLSVSALGALAINRKKFMK